jgi:DNA repair ATPase RecN
VPQRLAEIEQTQNGAHFVLADLHVHSSGASRDVRDSSMSPEAIIDAAVKKGIRVLSITDHNTARNLERARDYAARYLGQLLFIPGVEISTAHGHVLAYFADVEQVEHLLTLVGIVDRTKTEDGHTSKSLSDVISEIGQRGGVAIAAHIDREKAGFEMRSGYSTWKRDIVSNPSLFGFEFDDPSHLSWYTDDDSGGNSAERRKLIEVRKHQTYRTGLAAVQNSDSHRLVDFEGADDLTYIKLDSLDWSAFRTAFQDPGARIRSLRQVPVSYPHLIAIEIDGGYLDQTCLHFSSNLNVLFGGRGTGKSTVIQAIGYALGISADLAKRDDCPNRVTLYARDGAGLTYRYDRYRGERAKAKRLSENSIHDAPLNSVSVEYYSQNTLAKVSQNLTESGDLLQQFLDEHLQIGELRSREHSLLAALRENSARILPLEASARTLPTLQQQVLQFDKQLKAAEEGKLREIAAFQAALGNEQQFILSIRSDVDRIGNKLSLSLLRVDYDRLVDGAGDLLNTRSSRALHAAIREAVSGYNEAVKATEVSLRDAQLRLRQAIDSAAAAVKPSHDLLAKRIAARVGDLQRAGLKGNVSDLQSKVRKRAQLASQIADIQSHTAELAELKERRGALLDELRTVRGAVELRRRKQVAPINRNLGRTIREFIVIFHYDDTSGDYAEYWTYLLDALHGLYMHDEIAERFARSTTPDELLAATQHDSATSLVQLLKNSNVDEKWAVPMRERLSAVELRHKLETVWKPPMIAIKLLTRTEPQRTMNVSQLSDGQRHTILLTVAMLSESYVPLVIDQPEDDLDNAFISSTVVSVLREVKQRRQVIAVTHNANIAVLGDSELLFPMERRGTTATCVDQGSIDRLETREQVQKVLEGGRAAFVRRAELYNIR